VTVQRSGRAHTLGSRFGSVKKEANNGLTFHDLCRLDVTRGSILGSVEDNSAVTFNGPRCLTEADGALPQQVPDAVESRWKEHYR
jgi:hypothetical protein